MTTNMLGDHECVGCHAACDCCMPEHCQVCSRCFNQPVNPSLALMSAAHHNYAWVRKECVAENSLEYRAIWASQEILMAAREILVAEDALRRVVLKLARPRE